MAGRGRPFVVTWIEGIVYPTIDDKIAEVEVIQRAILAESHGGGIKSRLIGSCRHTSLLVMRRYTVRRP